LVLLNSIHYNKTSYSAGIPAQSLARSILAVLIIALSLLSSVQADNLPTFEELAVIRTKAHQDRFKKYVLQKLYVYSVVQKQRGLCLDFVGNSDGLYRSMFDAGPLMVDLANCGEEADLIDGRIRALKVLDAREHREGLSKEQVDQVIAEINAQFADKPYDPDANEP